MRLYSRTGATVHTDSEFGRFEADADGVFDVPEELGERMRRFHVDKQPMWEDSIERQQRLIDEDMQNAQNPATLLAVLQQLARALPPVPAVATAVPAAVSETPATAEASTLAARQPRKRAASKPPAE